MRARVRGNLGKTFEDVLNITMVSAAVQKCNRFLDFSRPVCKLSCTVQRLLF